MKNSLDFVPRTNQDFENLSIIVPAAGSGHRMGGNIVKQYMLLNGVPILQHTLERLLALGPNKIVLVVSENDKAWRSIALTERCCIVTGGASRSDSVLNGLNVLDGDDDDWVMVHDSVRPCVRERDISQLFSQLRFSRVGGLLGVPVVETLKKVSVDVVATSPAADSEKTDLAGESAATTEVMQTIPREEHWLAQTPQMFRQGLLRSALQLAGARQWKVTDEASAIELFGETPTIVQGSRDNIKITTPEDLLLAEYFLQQQADDRA